MAKTSFREISQLLGWTPYGFWGAIAIEDVAEGVITYGETIVSFFVNTFHPYDAPAGLELICENGRAELVGETATIIFADGNKKTASADEEARQRFGMKNYWGVSHVKQIQDFYDSIANGTPVKISGEEAIITQRLINGIYESDRVGATIQF